MRELKRKEQYEAKMTSKASDGTKVDKVKQNQML